MDENTIYTGCSIRTVGGPFGRRTVIFSASNVTYNGQTQPSDAVIKEQYIEVGRRFAEGHILEKIHGSGGDFPGVVRVESHGIVKSNGNTIFLRHIEKIGDTESGENIGSAEDTRRDKETVRVKKRLVLRDRAESLMQVHTPREFLMALYDLLESEFSSVIPGFSFLNLYASHSHSLEEV